MLTNTIANGFCARADFSPSRSYDLELQNRELRLSPLCVAEAANLEADAAGRAIPGAIWICFGTSRSDAMAHVREALSANGSQGLDMLHKLRSGPKTGRHCSVFYQPEQLSRSPLIAEVLYGMHRIAIAVFKHPAPPLICMSLPYSGGKLTHEDFTLAEYSRQENEIKLECCVFIQPPVLSKIEKYLFNLVPGEVSDVDFFQANTSPGTSAGSGLILLETGWAVGSFLAKVALAGLQKRWRTTQNAAIATPATSPSNNLENGKVGLEDIDTGMPAAELLGVRQRWITQKERSSKTESR